MVLSRILVTGPPKSKLFNIKEKTLLVASVWYLTQRELMHIDPCRAHPSPNLKIGIKNTFISKICLSPLCNIRGKPI